MRIVMIHALRHSQAPIEAAFARLWPTASLANLTDDSLAADLAALVRADPPAPGAPPRLYDPIQARFHFLSSYATTEMAGDALLFTCSAFGSYIDAVAARVAPTPVLKPNEAMLDDLLAMARASNATAADPFVVALAATFYPTLGSMLEEIDALRGASPDVHLRIVPVHIEGALEALNAGDSDRHNALAAAAVSAALGATPVRAVALAQFSLAQSAPLVAATTSLPVLTTPDAAVAALRRRLLAPSSSDVGCHRNRS